MLGKSILFVAIIAVFATCSSAIVYKKCDFVKALKNAGVEKKHWATWTCIAKYESDFDTETLDTSSGCYGILQINKRWCNDANTPGKLCGITCQSLLVNDITPSVKCALKVFDKTQKGPSKNGFTAWPIYKKYCTGDQSEHIKECKV